jgi:hypothetical protein
MGTRVAAAALAALTACSGSHATAGPSTATNNVTVMPPPASGGSTTTIHGPTQIVHGPGVQNIGTVVVSASEKPLTTNVDSHEGSYAR